MSNRIHINTSDRQSGRRHTRTSLTAAKIREAKAADALKEAERREGEAPPEDAERADADLFEGLRENSRRYPDLRKRRDRTQLQVDGFAKQLEQMADAYIKLGVAVAEGGGLEATYDIAADAETQESRNIVVVDVFSTSHQALRVIRGDAYIASACRIYAVHGLESRPSVRALCDIHGVAPRPWLGAQFSAAFDAYLAIRAEVDRRVQVALGRDTPHWRLKNSCPCCLYKLEGGTGAEDPPDGDLRREQLTIPFREAGEGGY
ncbi:hypothetical protein B0H14DRAFT_2590286 [Mycena olivaceomarginata]|nr:hypothetical protein B0H14DRAFT_2590286 [Mycena olivaceomarginata]